MGRLCVKLTSGDTLDVEMTAEQVEAACNARELIEVPTGDGAFVLVNPAQIVPATEEAGEVKPRPRFPR
jgi:hypothetical protein